MAILKPSHRGNALLGQLPRALGERFLAQCDDVELVVDERLVFARRSHAQVHFPQAGLIGVLAEVGGHEALEVAVIGRESVDGAMLALGVAPSAMRSVVLVGGRAWRIGVPRFRAELDANAILRRLVDRAVTQLFAQVARAVPCTRFHSLPSRLALWLLRAQDRVGESELRFTHLRLAGLLGVQRSAVTIAAGRLHRAGIIRYSRGELLILDRDRLEHAACACYSVGRRTRPPY
ncbi:MAG: Crp/Fnr family transcriptional regulator [Lysobacteraceae bacterium]